MQPTPETPKIAEAVPETSEAPASSDGAEKPAGLARKIDWGIPGSVLAHALVLALLIFGIPQWTHEADEPEAIDVELVPPPKPEAEKPPPPAPETPEPPKQEQEQQPEETAETRPPPSPPARVLRPVAQFGEKDAGPQQPQDGETPREATAEQATPTEEPAPKPETETAEAEPQSEPAEKPDEQTETPLPDDPKPAVPETLASVGQIPSPEIVPVPEPSPRAPPSVADEARAATASPANEAEKPLSQTDTNDPVATTAMNDLPRGVRAGELCANVLRYRLQNTVPPYYPDLLPTYRLDEGAVLQVNRGAFRSFGEWFNLRFRCEVDEDATRIVSFSYDVGSPIPRSEWAERGFPAR